MWKCCICPWLQKSSYSLWPLSRPGGNLQWTSFSFINILLTSHGNQTPLSRPGYHVSSHHISFPSTCLVVTLITSLSFIFPFHHIHTFHLLLFLLWNILRQGDSATGNSQYPLLSCMNGHNWHIPGTPRLYVFLRAEYADHGRASHSPLVPLSSAQKEAALGILASRR